jgi:TonB family protein
MRPKSMDLRLMAMFVGFVVASCGSPVVTPSASTSASPTPAATSSASPTPATTSSAIPPPSVDSPETKPAPTGPEVEPPAARASAAPGPIALPPGAPRPVADPRNKPPVYPRAQFDAGIEGAVILKLLVSETGDVLSAEPLSGGEPFVTAALEAARSWRYRPIVIDEVPRSVYFVVPVPFRRPRAAVPPVPR